MDSSDEMEFDYDPAPANLREWLVELSFNATLASVLLLSGWFGVTSILAT